MDYEDNEYDDNLIEHMMVNYDCHMNIGELPELIDEKSVDEFIANLNDWD